MSTIYDLLDDYSEEYETHESQAEAKCLNRAINQLDIAMQEQSLAIRLQGLRDAVALSKKLADRQVSLIFDFYLASELIGTANDMVEGLAVVCPAAMESRSKDYDLKSQRIGLNNLLASAYSLVDPLGYSREIEQIGLLLDASPLTDNEDLCIGLGAQYEVHIASGNRPAAEQTRDEIWAHARMLNDPLYYLHASAFDCELAFLAEDWQGMVNAACHCMQIVSSAEGGIQTDDPAADGDTANLESDSDYQVVSAAHACGLAKLGLGPQITHRDMSDLNSDLPVPFHYYLYWTECYLALGDHSTATKLAVQSWHEITGKGQDYREVQLLCLLIRCLLAADRQQELAEWVKLAQLAASRLRDPAPALKQIQALL
ncbi:hypothetical protein N9053_02060 [bacterium]|nr:hypothetical protein [Rhodopirellula sp.]MDB4557907.1 hypothetical protein [bacterium]